MASLASRPTGHLRPHYWLVCFLAAAAAACGSDDNSPITNPDRAFEQPTLAITPSFLDFSGVQPGSAGMPQKFSITNIGQGRTGPVAFAVDGADAGSFVVVGSTCGATVNPNESCEIRMTFMPKEPGVKVGRLNVAANPGSGASAGLTGTGQAANAVAMSPALFDFPAVLSLDVTGGPSTTPYPRAMFAIKNAGAAPVGPFTLTIEGKDAADFAVAENSCGSRLLGDAACGIAVRFRPEKIGAKTAMLVASAEGVKLTAALQGFGSERAMLTVTPDTQQFGAVPVGMKSANIFTVRNTGGSVSGKIAQSIVGLNVSDFQVVASSCPETLAPNDDCSVTVAFAPLTAGTKAAVLHLDATPGGSAAVSLQATGVSTSTLSMIAVGPAANPPFGDVPVGAQSAAVFVVENRGVGPAGKPLPSILGPNSSEFVVTGDTCPPTLDPGVTCTVNVTFTPAAIGTRTASLQVSASPGGYASAALTGNGIKGASLGIKATTKDFGKITVGQQSNTTEFTISNNGIMASGPLTLSIDGADAAQFQIAITDCIGRLLAPDANCHASVRFAPTTLGNKIATLTVSGMPGGIVRATLTGGGK